MVLYNPLAICELELYVTNVFFVQIGYKWQVMTELMSAVTH